MELHEEDMEKFAKSYSTSVHVFEAPVDRLVVGQEALRLEIFRAINNNQPLPEGVTHLIPPQYAAIDAKKSYLVALDFSGGNTFRKFIAVSLPCGRNTDVVLKLIV
jgi:hypothetical protein